MKRSSKLEFFIKPKQTEIVYDDLTYFHSQSVIVLPESCGASSVSVKDKKETKEAKVQKENMKFATAMKKCTAL